jgi:hypothetical protein
VTPTEEPTPERTRPPKPVCNLLTDPVGDVTNAGGEVADIVSGDVASGETTVVVVLRLRSLDPSAGPAQGSTWRFAFGLGTRTYEFEASRGPTGETASSLTATEPGGTPQQIPVTLTFSGSYLEWEAARAALPDLATSTTFRDLTATTFSGTGTTALAADATSATATYEDRHPSCLKAG